MRNCQFELCFMQRCATDVACVSEIRNTVKIAVNKLDLFRTIYFYKYF
jgi:hypothetical protein